MFRKVFWHHVEHELRLLNEYSNTLHLYSNVQLEDTDVLNCGTCNIRMKEILLCDNRRNDIDYKGKHKTRCKMIICSDCGYCENCYRNIEELKFTLIKYRHGKDGKKKVAKDT